MVKERVQLDTGLGGSELGPGEQGQAQVNNRGVETEQFVFKREFMSWRLWQTPPVEFAEQGFEKGVRPRVVGVGKGRPGHGFDSEMVEPLGGSVHAHDPVSKTLASGQLNMQKVDKLVPPEKCSGRAFSSMVLG